MARTTLGDALDRLAEAAVDVTDLARESSTGEVVAGGQDGDGDQVGRHGSEVVGRALGSVVVDLEDAAGSSLGPVEGDAEVVLLRRLDRARRLLLAARTAPVPALQVC